MRSLRLHAPRDLRMHDEPVPMPGPGEALVRVASVGICASDVHYYRDGRIGSTILTGPIVLGHEASGVIAALGEGVTAPPVGARVAIEPARPCMRCEFCRAGHYNVCPDIPFFGSPPTDGCLRDYVCWPAELCLPVPDSVSFVEAAMTEPLAIGLHAVSLAGVPAGPGRGEASAEAHVSDRPSLYPANASLRRPTAAVLGAGAIGLSVLQALKVAGIERVIVSEPIRKRRELAARLGACGIIDPSSSNSEEEVAALTDGRGADMVFECTGEEDAVREACRIARPLGKLVILGIPAGEDYPFDASTARRKELTAVFVRRSNATTERAIELVARGHVDVACFATHHFPLERAADALELALSRRDGVVRAMVRLLDTQ